MTQKKMADPFIMITVTDSNRIVIISDRYNLTETLRTHFAKKNYFFNKISKVELSNTT